MLTLFLLAMSVCQAQSKKPKKTLEQKSIEMTKKLSKEVKLNKQQILEARAIYLAYLKDKAKLEDKIDDLKKGKKIKINALLTTEQKEKKEIAKKKKKKK